MFKQCFQCYWTLLSKDENLFAVFYGLDLPCTIISVCVLLHNEIPEARASQGKEVYLVSSLEAETPKTENANWHRLSQRSM